MGRLARCASLWAAAAVLGAQAPDGPDALLERIQRKMAQNLNRLPDYVCLQTVERSRRQSPAGSYQPLDTLRVEVGLVGNRELYSWPDSSGFEDKELAEMIGRGVVGTGHFALLAKHVFLSRVAEFTWKGEDLLNGRAAVRFDYQVPRNLSSYRIRVPPNEAVVGFHGSVWVAPDTLDLVRLEVRSNEIPEPLGMAEAVSIMDYARAPIGNSDFLLPQASELRLVTLSGEENRNRGEFTGCRQYRSESSLSFDEPSAQTGKPPGAPTLPPGSEIELSLDQEIDPEAAALGDSVRAVLARPLRQGQQVIAPEGAAVLGRVVRVEKQVLPFPHYIVALQFHTLDLGASQSRFLATMEDAGPAPGLIRQKKRLDPTFTRRRSARMDILVNEQQPGQGVIHWDARQQRIRRGLKMRWRVDPGR
ncbi:MAG: hypothetical protein FJW37_06405 [Acidobacteria bacterium]|nr:hypothetical protein [Acidobacteriota bacterium]